MVIELLITCYLTYVLYYFLNVTYVHRDLTHRQIEFSSAMVKAIKIFEWLTVPDYSHKFWQKWVAGHLQHHAESDTEKDIHSPFHGYKFPKYEMKPVTDEMLQKIKNHPRLKTTYFDDWLEVHKGGYWFTVVALLILFQWHGVAIALTLRYGKILARMQYNWAHTLPGYNHKPQKKGTARNYPYMVWSQLGEELHGNHHLWPNRANFAVKWYEVDVTYQILRVMSFFKLVTIKPLKNIDTSKFKAFYEKKL